MAIFIHRLCSVIALGAIFLLFGSLYSCSGNVTDTPTKQLSGKKYVRGFIAVQLHDVKKTDDLRDSRIFIPGVKMTLTNIASSESTDVISDLSGRFNFPAQISGDYKLCWQRAGYQSECRSSPVQISSRPVNVDIIEIRPDADFETTVVVYGTVFMRDEELGRELQPLVGINSFANIEALDNNGNTFYQTPVNNQGMYVVPAVPRDEIMVAIQASVEKETMTSRTYKEVLQTGHAHRVDVIMRNHLPRILDVVSRVGGKDVEIAQAGDTISLSASAHDADNDQLRYEWYVTPGEGTLSNPNNASTTWKLPAQKGRYTAVVHVKDDHGGYSVGKSTVRVGLDKARFSGRVVTVFGSPISAAEVQIGGTGDTAATNADGYFNLTTALTDRYVLNIRKPGFAAVSRIYRRSFENGTWRMQNATVVTVDPTQDIVVSDNPQQKDYCYVPAFERVVWSHFPGVQNRRRQDGTGRTYAVEKEPYRNPYPPELIAQRKRGQCGQGVELFIPANSLQDKDGNAPPGPVTIELNTVDLLAPDSMPGDFSADDGSYLISYGASTVEVSAGGVEFSQIADGQFAILRIPVSDAQLAAGGTIPPTIPKLVYNEETGLWEAEGEFTLDASGTFYEAEVSHFSTINTDIQKTGQSCVRFKSEDMPIPFQLDVIVPIPDAAPVQRTAQINANDEYNLIINLPNDTEITLLAYTVVNDQVVPHGVFTVDTNGAQSGNPAAPNFSECQTKVVLRPVTLPEPGPDAFLHGLYSFIATKVQENDGTIPNQALKDQLEDATIDYYNTVDPRGLRNTFDKFKQANGLAADGNPAIKASYGPGDEVRAAYANAIDLGFGRDMHGKRVLADDGEWDIAFYVSNYGDYDSDDIVDQQNAANQNADELVATVAMEWSRIEDGPASDYDYYDPDNTDPDPNDPAAPIVFSDNERVIKFYVYNKLGEPVFAADLDNRGVRPIPQLCMVCHGGAYDTGFETGTPAFSQPSDVKLGAVMLPFDIHGYEFSPVAPANFSKANQQLEIFELNNMVVDTEPGAVIEEIIDEMYSPTNPAGADNQLEDFVVAGWNANGAHQDMYLNVIKPACRVCHASRPLEDTGGGGTRDLRFHSVNHFLDAPPEGIAAVASTRVCVTREMPHALATYNRFWYSYNPLSPLEGVLFQPSRMQAFFDGVVEPVLGGALGSNCVTTPDIDDSVIEEPAKLSDIQANIFTGCAGCHGGSFGGINMDLGDGSAHGAIVNVAAQESSGGLDRIEPNSVNQSYLYKKVDDDVAAAECTAVQAGQDCTDAMPPGSSGLSAAELEDLAEWINDGAQSN